MSNLQACVDILASEFTLDAGAMREVEEWLESKERKGDDPKPWAEGMCLKLKQAREESGKDPVGLMLWCIRQGGDKADYRSLAPQESFGASKVRKFAQVIASKCNLSYSDVLEIHEKGGLPWPLMNMASPPLVERAFNELRAHAHSLGFENIRITRKTPSYHDGEWSWEPQPTGFDPEAVSEYVAATVAKVAAEHYA